MNRALVLFSGGMDSTYCLFHALRHYHSVMSYGFGYGQVQSERELSAAHLICAKLDVPFMPLDLSSVIPRGDRFGISTYKSYEDAKLELKDQIEPAFVPMRNAIFLSVLAGLAIRQMGYGDSLPKVLIGICAEDAWAIPDCSTEFIEAFNFLTCRALGIQDRTDDPLVQAPIIGMQKSECIKKGILEMPGYYAALAFSHSSYFNDYPPIKRDLATLNRETAFDQAGVLDPLLVRAYWEDLIDFPEAGVYNSWKDHIDYMRKPNPDEIVQWDLMMEFENRVRLELISRS